MNDRNNEPRCSFCGRSQNEVQKLIAGPGVYICDECIAVAQHILEEEKQEVSSDFQLKDLPTPRQIKETLDEYVIGQEAAKKTLAVAVYNHYKRLQTNSVVEDVELQKSNIIMVGPTGCGKTLLAQTLARLLDVPFAIADATSLTEAGYVGEDVENCLLKLIQAADYDIAKAERGIIYIDEIDKTILNRTTDKNMGFGADIHSKEEHSMESLLKEIIPTDLQKFGLIPELIGRLPVLVTLNPLDEEAMVHILTEPKNALVKQYQKMLDMDDVELEFTPEALQAIAKEALRRNTGARGLRSIIERIMLDVMFDVPSRHDVEKCVVTEDCVTKGTEPDLVLKQAK